MYLRLAGRDVRLVVHRPDATDADLARAAGLPVPPDPRLLADAGFRRGDSIDATAGGDRGDRSAGGVTVAVVEGIDCGDEVRLPAGAVVEVGRAAGCTLAVADPTVSRRHARLAVGPAGEVRVHDAASRNGTWLLGPDREEEIVGSVALEGAARVRVGASVLSIGGPDVADGPIGELRRPTGLTGTIPHNRPPRPALPPAPDPVEVPSPPEPSGPRLPLSVVAILGPLAMAGAMVWLLGKPAFALFALLSPVLAIGNHVEGGRRERTGTRRHAARWAASLAAFTAGLAAAAEVEVERRLRSAPDPAEVLRRATQPSMWLWERRPHHDDWLQLRVGTGAVPWSPPLRGERHGPRPDDLAVAVDAASVLAGCPVTVDLAGGGVVGVVGGRDAAVAVARSLLLQAAVHHGPSDLAVLVACEADRVGDWDWTKWLPHVEDPTGGPRRTATGRAEADLLAGAWPGGGRATALAVVDGADLLTGRRAPLRALLDGRHGPVAGIVVAATTDRLPSSCSAVVVVGEAGGAELRLPPLGIAIDGVRVMGIGRGTAARGARALTRFDDPELDASGAALPPFVGLADLLDLDDGAVGVAHRWATGGPDPAPSAPIGVDADGPVEIDLALDGPHALVAGTTGAGKSELLRTLVVGLAAGCSPDHLTFVLVDFKGGSAFDACARLPHTVGVVTDLDDALAERALRCLDAELRHRERLLRAAGAPDLTAYRTVPGREPLPRLVVVVDEFATLKAELPDFVDALVGVAQRGRSLGVHLVLATQRPAGSVSDHVRANANLRVALRVQDVSDSTDVIDGPQAAALPRSRPGRACIRLGPGELFTVQTALATTRSGAAGPPVELVPFTFSSRPDAGDSAGAASPAGRGPTDLDRLVDACTGAFAASGRPPPRRPWPEPLPERLDAADGRLVGEDRSLVVVGLADDPDRQSQGPAGWRPADGNLAVYGVAGAGTTTTLLAVALARARVLGPERLQVFGLDHGAGDLAVLRGLPHVAAVVGATERERQQRLVRHLRAELDRRKASGAAAPPDLPDIDVLVDGVGSFLADFDDVAGMEVAEAFGRVFADGPEVGIRLVVAAERAGALPAALTATVRQRWVHRLADGLDAATTGVSRGADDRVSSLPPGRYLDACTGLEVQVAVPACGWASAVAAIAASAPTVAPSVPAPVIRDLPADVDLASIAPGRAGGAGPWTIAVGLADHDLGPAHLALHPGDHVLVAGPPRSGRTTALATIASSVLGATPAVPVVVVAGRRSWLGDVPGVVAAGSVADAVAVLSGRAGLLLVDDADDVEDDPAIATVLAGDSAVHVVAAGRADVLRGLYAHWTRTVRRSRLGLLLRPHVDLDGDLLGAVLPRRSSAPWVAGRGYLVVDGSASLVQVARLPTCGP